MTLSLSLWAELSGKGRIELAERSGIWRVTLDKSSLQTRTMDKYLLMETVPAKPRWRDVVRTAEFVLGEAEKRGVVDGPPALRCAELRTRLKALRDILRDGAAQRAPSRTSANGAHPAAQPLEIAGVILDAFADHHSPQAAFIRKALHGIELDIMRSAWKRRGARPRRAGALPMR